VKSLESILKEIKKGMSRTRLLTYITNISSFHRIQGTKYLVDAGNYIKDVLEDSNLYVEVLDYSYRDPHPWLPPLIGWWVRDGEVYLLDKEEKILSSFSHASTAIVAHSPPGYFEGRVTYVGREKEIPEGVEVVLLDGGGILKYLEAVEKGAQAVLFFRRDAAVNALPYIGLFPTPQHLPKLRAPALTLSRRDAESIISRLAAGEEVKVKGFVDSGFTDPSPIRVIYASLSPGNDGEGITVMTAHYCHPAGTINDNVSGAASLLLAASALSKASSASGKGFNIAFGWVPEHYGSLPLVKHLVSEGFQVQGAINLDMVGEKQSLTGSTLYFVRPPIHMLSSFEAATYQIISHELGPKQGFHVRGIHKGRLRFDILNYEYGSDHDSFIAYGIPSVSLINWPDKYYHSSLDFIDKVDWDGLTKVAYASMKAALINSSILSVYTHYKLFVKGMDLMQVSRDGKLVELRRILYEEGLETFLRPPKEIVSKGKGIVTVGGLSRFAQSGPCLDLVKLGRSRGWLSTALILTVKLASAGIGKEGLKRAVEAELGLNVGEDVFEKIIQCLAEKGVLGEL